MQDRGPYRSNYCIMFDDSQFRNLPRDAKQLLTMLKMTRLTNMAHIFYCDTGCLVTLSEQTGMTLEEVKNSIRILSEYHWVYYQDNILWIRNGLKFEPTYNPNNQNHRTCIQNILKGLPKSEIVVKYCQYYGFEIPFEWPSNGAPIVSEDYSDTIRSTETETETNTDTENILSNADASDSNKNSPKGKGKVKRKPLKEYHPEVVRITKIFADLIFENKPDRTYPKVRSPDWLTDTADAIDKMVRLDKRKLIDVEDIIRFSQADNEPRGKNKFCWAPNILSGKKLREKFDRLQTDMRTLGDAIGFQKTGDFAGRDGQSAV